MEALRIFGGAPLCGEISVSGSKNASLPLMAAALLAPGESVLRGVPHLADVKTLCALLERMGVGVARYEDELRLDCARLDTLEAPYELVRTMRASFLVLGPLLARFGRARVSLPGGCAIGARPVDQHLDGLARLGARISIEHGYVIAEAPEGLVGDEVHFATATVGGTENLMLAASAARGTTVLHNCAREPEIVELAAVLEAMGARIQGAGTDCMHIEGAQTLRPFNHRVMPDRIEFGTFLVAGALAGEGLVITHGVAEHQHELIACLRRAGVRLEIGGERIVVHRVEKAQPLHVSTAPYPGFPTDMQAQLMALLSLADGESSVSETIFENRFMHAAELNRLGARIRADGGEAVVVGVERLSGTTVMATDLRASACLVLAGLVAEGETVVRRIYHLDRGYEHIESKLRAVGARIERFAE